MGRCLQCGSRGRSLARGQRGTWGKRERGSLWKPRSLSPWEAIRPFPQMSSFKTARPCEYILHYSHFANKELTSWGGKTTQLDHGRGRCALSQAPVLPGRCTQESKPGLLGIKWLFFGFLSFHLSHYGRRNSYGTSHLSKRLLCAWHCAACLKASVICSLNTPREAGPAHLQISL